MAMAGRLRSGIPLLRRGLTAETVSSSAAERSVATRAVLCPSFTNTEFMRNYATGQPAKEQKVTVPVTMFGVSGNYASALYISAVKANVLDKVESELLTLVEASKKSPTFSQFMKDLSVTADTRVKAINDICTQAKFSDITKNFLTRPLARNRTGEVFRRQGRIETRDDGLTEILRQLILYFGYRTTRGRGTYRDIE
ncbi:UNVERIFIED_CONTAM: ATP synthase subunit O, mitochondrial [Sesamum angustifolium]|uniref:ATP synthase subunit O, mitochondrial n=1 Tax=Sesamum angustifolium TaxID=2727405 RepID=A0AAW2RIJ3_9LAMI